MTTQVEELCNRHKWRLLSSTEAPGINEHSRLAVILLATWSVADFELLSEIADKLRGLAVEVYDIDQFMTQSNVESFFGKIPLITQTPVLLLYGDGQIESFVQGEALAEWELP